jgi:hypothetical protein
VSQLERIPEDEESIEIKKRKQSPEKIIKNIGADVVYEREITFT